MRQLEKEWENKDLTPSAAEKALIDEYAHGEDDDFLNSLTSVKQPKSKKCVDWVRDVVDQVQMANSWLPSLALTERRVAKSIFRGFTNESAVFYRAQFPTGESCTLEAVREIAKKADRGTREGLTRIFGARQSGPSGPETTKVKVNRVQWDTESPPPIGEDSDSSLSSGEHSGWSSVSHEQVLE